MCLEQGHSAKKRGAELQNDRHWPKPSHCAKERSGVYTNAAVLLGGGDCFPGCLPPNAGRNFRREKAHIYLQCRFNAEILTTDPVEHLAQPVWDTAFSWTVSPKLLSQLRSQRTHLKLSCYSLNEDNSSREIIGYVMLDLRSPTQHVWLPLVNTRNSAFRPEILVDFRISNPQDHVSLEAATASAVAAPVVAKPRPKSAVSQPKKLLVAPKTTVKPASAPVQNTKQPTNIVKVELHGDGWYQVENDAAQDVYFTLWISISFAENLMLLSPTSVETGYYFHYNLFGNDIMTQQYPLVSLQI